MALRIKIWLKSGFPLPPIYLKEYSINYMDAQLQRKDKPMKMADDKDEQDYGKVRLTKSSKAKNFILSWCACEDCRQKWVFSYKQLGSHLFKFRGSGRFQRTSGSE